MSLTPTVTETSDPPRRRVAWWLPMLVTPGLRWLVIRLAVPVDEPPRTRCPHCGAGFGPACAGRAALWPTGRCGQCRTRLGAPPFLLEVALLVAVLAAVTAAPTVPVLLAGVWWALCAVAASFVDAAVHRLPDIITIPAAAGTLALLALDVHHPGRLLAAAATALGAGVLFLVSAMLLGRRGMGLGDVKLILSVAALTGWWGWGVTFTAVFLGFLAAGLTGITLLATRRFDRRSDLPLGPFFTVGTAATLALLALAR